MAGSGRSGVGAESAGNGETRRNTLISLDHRRRRVEGGSRVTVVGESVPLLGQTRPMRFIEGHPSVITKRVLILGRGRASGP